jgi:hypothetical protein
MFVLIFLLIEITQINRHTRQHTRQRASAPVRVSAQKCQDLQVQRVGARESAEGERARARERASEREKARESEREWHMRNASSVAAFDTASVSLAQPLERLLYRANAWHRHQNVFSMRSRTSSLCALERVFCER